MICFRRYANNLYLEFCHFFCLKFGSWDYHAEEVNITTLTAAQYDLFIENPRWSIKEAVPIRSAVTIMIERRSSIYQVVILAPAFVVILLTLLTFWLPSKCGEKILLNSVTALIIVQFLLNFSQKIDAMASQTPLVGKFKKNQMFGQKMLIEEILFFFSLLNLRQFYSIVIHYTWSAFLQLLPLL